MKKMSTSKKEHTEAKKLQRITDKNTCKAITIVLIIYMDVRMPVIQF